MYYIYKVTGNSLRDHSDKGMRAINKIMNKLLNVVGRLL